MNFDLISKALGEAMAPAEKSMTREQLEGYVVEQVNALKADTDPEVKKQRALALKSVVDAAKAYSFEQQSTMSVQVFDESSVTTTEAMPPKGAGQGTFKSFSDVHDALVGNLSAEEAAKRFGSGGGGGGGGTPGMSDEERRRRGMGKQNGNGPADRTMGTAPPRRNQQGGQGMGGPNNSTMKAEAPEGYEFVAENDSAVLSGDMGDLEIHKSTGQLMRKCRFWGADPTPAA